ncbi:MAG: hypothetical protein HPY53_01495 [Brevinematales bacterium]|nr:hypothetical protein [Brevinematales bacterium]
MDELLKGKEAKEYVEKALKYAEDHKGYGAEVYGYKAGYYEEGKVYVAFDNTDNCCWVEEFKSPREAEQWCLGEIDSDGYPVNPSEWICDIACGI